MFIATCCWPHTIDDSWLLRFRWLRHGVISFDLLALLSFAVDFLGLCYPPPFLALWLVARHLLES